MPPLARRYLKTSLFFGGLGILTGMHMSSALHLQAGSNHRWYMTAHTHMMLVGFMLMMFMAALLWKLPQAPSGSRYKPALMVWVYWILTLTSIVRYSFNSAIGYLTPEPEWMHMAIFLISSLQGFAIIAFFINILPRVNAPEDAS
jgi:hypothetical protein